MTLSTVEVAAAAAAAATAARAATAPLAAAATNCARWSLLAAAAVLAGCGSAPVAPTASHSVLAQGLADAAGRVPRPLASHVQTDRAEGPRNVVLNAMLAGKVALDMGAHKQARSALDLAYQRIETIYANNDAAAKARSTFVPEANKDFKGEPFERAMVGYYLGLADLMAGDLDNAKSSFRWGEFQDTMSASEQYQSDMASLMFLTAWVDQCQGRHAAAAERFGIARQARPALKAPSQDHNVLFILEAGSGPSKTRKGSHGEELSYVPAAELAADTEVDFRAGAQLFKGALAEDLHWQANTLGGRQVDKILAGKAVFKENATQVARVGQGAAMGGSQVMRIGAELGDRRMLNLGAATAVGGLLFSMIGSATAAAARPEADTRTWSNLPAAVFITTGRLEAGAAGQARVQVSSPAQLGALSREATPQAIPGTSCHLARLSTIDAPTWNASDPGAWVAVDELSRLPTASARRNEAPDSRSANRGAAASERAAPVRSSF